MPVTNTQAFPLIKQTSVAPTPGTEGGGEVTGGHYTAQSFPALPTLHTEQSNITGLLDWTIRGK